MLNKYGERTQPCRTSFSTWNHSDSVPATLTLASCFLYSLASESIKCREYHMSIIVIQNLSWEIESNVFLKSTKHTHRVLAGARVPCASVFWNSWFGLLFPFLVEIQPVCLQFLFRSLLGSCSVICTQFKIVFLGKWDERGERPILWPVASFFRFCAFYPVLSGSFLSCFYKFKTVLYLYKRQTTNIDNDIYHVFLPRVF